MFQKVSNFLKISADNANIANFAIPVREVVEASSKYPHTKYEVNILIQYQLMGKYRFQTYSAVSRPS